MSKINVTACALSKSQMQSTKGGVIVYCEEKRRRSAFGEWTCMVVTEIVMDNKLGIVMMTR